MSGIGPRNMGHGPDVGLLRFVDGIIAPPSSPDPIFYRVGDQLFMRDTDGNVSPVVVGADGAGVKTVTAAMSPYDILPTDRVLLVNTSAGAVTVKLPAAGGPFSGRSVLVLDAAANFATHACTLSGNTKTINGAASVVLSTTDASALVTWGSTEWLLVGGSSGSSTPFDPHSPGPIGDVTPDTMGTTQLTSSTFIKSDGVILQKGVSLAGGLANYVKQTGLALATAAVEQAFQFAGGAVLTLLNKTANATSRIGLHVFSATLADNATTDYDNGGNGGLLLLVVPGATGSQLGIVSFAQNAVTTLSGGPAYTNFSTTLTTAGKINVGASGGKVRIENKIGSSVDVFALIVLGVAT